MACTSGTRGEHPRRMLKKAVQQGRSTRDGLRSRSREVEVEVKAEVERGPDPD